MQEIQEGSHFYFSSFTDVVFRAIFEAFSYIVSNGLTRLTQSAKLYITLNTYHAWAACGCTRTG